MDSMDPAEHDTEATIILPPDVALRLSQDQAKRWKWVAIPCFLFLMLNLTLDVWGRVDRGKQLNGIEHTVDILEKATGPESQEAQARVVRDLVIAVDCNQRATIQEFADELEDQGIIGDVTLLPLTCTDAESSTNPNE